MTHHDKLSTMPPLPCRRLLSVAALCGFTTLAHAANGSWSSATGGLWSDSTRWLDGKVPDGSGAVANFAALDLTVDTTVSLDGPRTLVSLTFGDKDPATAAGWVLNNNGNPANTLTLGGVHAITVNELGAGKTVTVDAEIAGAAGLNKAGAGTLVLARTNTYTGSTMVHAGTVVVGANNALGPGNLGLDNGTTLAAPTGSVITLANAAVSFGTGPGHITFGDAAHAGGLIFAGTPAVGGYPKNITVSPGVSVTFTGALAGNLNAKLTKTGEGTLVLTGGSAFPAATTVSAGTLVLAGACASPVSVDATGMLQIGTGAGTPVTFGGHAGIRINDGGTFKLGDLVAGALDGADAVVNFSAGTYDFQPAGKLDLGGALNNLPAGDHTYKIFSKEGKGAEPALANISGYDATVSVTSFDKGVLSFKSLPKGLPPATYGLIGAGVLALLGVAGAAVWAIRRRKRPVVADIPPPPEETPPPPGSNHLPPPPGA